ncbi:MAG: hypothetical protein FJ138_04440 [Deltaproteobacteria bacterium]|nr:hypothetical protein [Deltaproteobacteria bacterium]
MQKLSRWRRHATSPCSSISATPASTDHLGALNEPLALLAAHAPLPPPRDARPRPRPSPRPRPRPRPRRVRGGAAVP